MIRVIAARELRGLLCSPLAWTLAAIVQFILAWLFLALVEEFVGLQSRLLGLPSAPGVTDLIVAPLLRATAWLLLLVTPLLTMRLISEERRQHTLELLLSSPVAAHEIVLGKYLGLLAFQGLLMALIVLMPLSLLLGGGLDLGKLAAGLLGLILVVASFTAAGLYLSILTVQPSLAAVATFGLLLLSWVFDTAAGNDPSGLMAYLALPRHFDPLLKGLVNSADLMFFLLFSAGFLGLAIRRLDNERLRP